MHSKARLLTVVCLLLIVAAIHPPAAAQSNEIKFKDVTAELGIRQALGDWRVAHAGAWGDVNGDGRPDLYLGAFAGRPVFQRDNPPIPNPLFINTPDGFELSPEKSVRFEGKHARTTGSVFVDLDNDGDLDLFASNHAFRDGHVPSALFENTGDGAFRDVSPSPWPFPERFTTRNVAPIDIDRDGLLDLVLADGRYGNTENARPVVLRNKGDFQFEEVAQKYGLARPGTTGWGMATGDVNNDGRLDILFGNSNRLFLSQDDGTYRPYTKTKFRGARADNAEAHPCGAELGDLNGDGLLDMVTTVHGQPGQIDVYINNGSPNDPRFDNITQQAGLEALMPKQSELSGLPVKGAQVRILDFDNDGRNDIAMAIVYRDQQGNMQPVVLRNLGNQGGTPRFTPLPMDRLIGYYAPGPMADYDRDGRIDIALPSWFEELPTYVMRNVTDAGSYLDVTVSGDGESFNTMGIGATVRLYEAGKAGDAGALLGRADITVGNGYSSGSEARAHFGLGERTACDVVVTWRGQTKQQQNVEAGQTIDIGPFSQQ